MNKTQTIIQVEGLTASYEDELILDNISFHIDRGEVFAILGGSGCGKSTLLKHMIGLLRPDSGRILIDGDDMVTADLRTRRRILRKIGVTFQNGALFGSMTLLQNVRLALDVYSSMPRKAANLVALMKLELVGLRQYASHMPSELSGGMQKRAAIARAMVLDPEILFMDEPSAGLDPITSANLDELIVKLAKTLHMTFVIVTHELPSVFAVADKVIMLEKNAKKIIASGTTEQLKNKTDNPVVHQFLNRYSYNKV